ncbi:jg20891 [Pararge aegeria aegeria]|uniref:Jg20891 protein n=1 Tax=Pararge aegeria aegeria TaxID=348720 RepID=A0A8S4RKV4_9NEOP|nr:jg20891 [Pararge aegeria aegeria]
MAERVQSSYIPSVSARPAMEADECYDSASASSPGAEHADPQTPPHYNAEPEKEFILKYESLPQLWDTSDIRYSNRFERYRALGQLLPIYQKVKPYATIEDIKKKINSLRSNYRRELKKYIASMKTGGSIVYYPKVWYFPYLNFLRKLENDDDQDKSMQRVEKTESTQSIQENRSSKPKSILQSLCSEPKSRSPVPTLKMRKKLYQEKFRPSHYSPNPYQNQHQCPKISNPLALEWSQTLARLDPLQRLYAKKAINDVLFEAELGSLHKHSVRINEASSYYIRTSPDEMSGAEDLADPPSSSIQKSDPISVKTNDSTSDVDCKFPITFLHCNLENDTHRRETEFGD